MWGGGRDEGGLGLVKGTYACMMSYEGVQACRIGLESGVKVTDAK